MTTICNYNVQSQNLVINSGFEDIKDSSLMLPCQYSRDGSAFSKSLYGWQSHKSVTADILVYKSNILNCFPILPHNGKNMAGFIAYHPYMDSGYDFDYHEIIEGTFIEPLIIGKSYQMSFWLYSDDSIGYKHLRSVLGNEAKKVYGLEIDSIGIRFSTTGVATKIHCSKLNNNNEYKPQISIALSKHKKDNPKWQLYEAIFIADSAYRYFALGNFKCDSLVKSSLSTTLSNRIDSINLGLFWKKNKRIFFEKSKRIAYYLIDDFYCRLVSNSPILLSEAKPYTIQNLLFENAKAIILPTSFSELNELVLAIKKMPQSTTITLAGHTDNIGNEVFNQKLSLNRANAVADYLIANGIDKNQFIVTGYGSSQPIAPNDSEKNRSLNRRVKIKVRKLD